MPSQRLQLPAWAPFLLALVAFTHSGAENPAENPGSASISDAGSPTISAGAHGESRLAVSPKAQGQLLLAAIAHAGGCYAGAEVAFGEAYALPRTGSDSLHILIGVARTCAQAPPNLGHASGCGPEVRFYALSTLAALPLYMLDLAG
ncbi:hypothetical protein T492DRAFT_877995, partial [Pavlovales sp. CCMP2436]